MKKEYHQHSDYYKYTGVHKKIEGKEMLEYKCRLYGNKLIVIDRFFPSSKMCSECGCIKEDLKLSDRIYKCEHCGFIEDRDVNASINIKLVATGYSET